MSRTKHLLAHPGTEAHQSEDSFRLVVDILDAGGIERARVELSSDGVLEALYIPVRATVILDAREKLFHARSESPKRCLIDCS